MTATKTKSKKKSKPKSEARGFRRKHPLIPEMIEIGARLASARRLQGMSQVVLGRKIGTSAQAIGQVEQGWRAPTLPWLVRAAKAVGSSAAWVLVGIDEHLARAVARVQASSGRQGKKTG